MAIVIIVIRAPACAGGHAGWDGLVVDDGVVDGVVACGVVALAG